MTLTKAELADLLFEKVGLNKREAKDMVEAFFEEIRNAFTPNGDTRNDTFRPILNGFLGWNYRFMVFDRWGLPAFDTRDRNTGWDGTHNGVEAPLDVYVWKVIVERDGDARDFIGHVTLVR